MRYRETTRRTLDLTVGQKTIINETNSTPITIGRARQNDSVATVLSIKHCKLHAVAAC